MRDKNDDAERDLVCDQYDRWLRAQILAGNPRVLAELKRLATLAERPQGVILGCYCAPKRCHGQTVKTAILSLLEKRVGKTKTKTNPNPNQPSL